MGQITHIVLFKLKEGVSKEEVKAKMLALKEECQQNGRPYIASISGGENCSPEHFHKGMHLGFVVIFKTAADRDHYLTKDQAHIDFGAWVTERVEDAVVFDYAS